MNDQFFRTLLDLFMVSDPWPLDEEDHELMRGILNEQSSQRGFDSWIDAYHDYDPTPPDPDGQTAELELIGWDLNDGVAEVRFPDGWRYQFYGLDPMTIHLWLKGDTTDFYREEIEGEYRYARVGQ